jgi:integrase
VDGRKGCPAVDAERHQAAAKRRGAAAGVSNTHAHRWRHNFAHEWHRAGGNTGDLMLLLGWASEGMPRRYGASAAAERAQKLQVRMGIGENV